MPTVLLLTAENLPFQEQETTALATALTGVGITAPILPWTDPRAQHMPADLVIIRSTWDYTLMVDEFLVALKAFQAPVLNSPAVVEWNCHKGYLLTLAAAGVPIIPTVMVRRGVVDSMPDLPFGSAEIIIKPATSAGAHGVGRFTPDDPAALTHLQEQALTKDVLIQPFAPDILNGECSLIYFGGEFSHAVRKVPASNDFRVQFEHGGTKHQHQPTDAQLAVAAAAMAQVPGDLLYARVDLVDTASGPQIMELELIEPELFLLDVPGSAERFADLIAARL